jgi:hypothetical protein
MNELYLYFTPNVVYPQLRLDDGQAVIGYGPVGAHGRSNAYHFQLPPNASTQGGTLNVKAPDYQPLEQRGLVVVNPTGEATFQADDFRLVPAATAPAPPKGELDEGKQEPIKPPVG